METLEHIQKSPADPFWQGIMSCHCDSLQGRLDQVKQQTLKFQILLVKEIEEKSHE